MGDPAPNPPSEDAIPQAYAALERLYSEGRWSDAKAAGESLLAALTALAANSDQNPGCGAHWRARVLLMLGHTQLYGLADPATASSHYREALAQDPAPEPLLREIAEAGLNQCETGAKATADATPWLAPTEEVPPGGSVVRGFLDSVQPVQIAKTPDKDLLPPIHGEADLERQKPITAAPTPITTPKPTPSPEDQGELAQGLLRVVIRAN